jgi:hypothetical protein
MISQLSAEKQAKEMEFEIGEEYLEHFEPSPIANAIRLKILQSTTTTRVQIQSIRKTFRR